MDDRGLLRRAVRGLVAVAAGGLAAVGTLVVVESGFAPTFLTMIGVWVVAVLVIARSEPRRSPAPMLRVPVGAVAVVLILIGGEATLGPGGLLAAVGGCALWAGLAPGGWAGLRALGLAADGERLWARLVRQARLGVRPGAIRRELHDLDDRLLLDVWRACRRPPDQRQNASALLGVAGIRELLLDELEERDPAAFHAWLDAGARTPAPSSGAPRAGRS